MGDSLNTLKLSGVHESSLNKIFAINKPRLLLIRLINIISNNNHRMYYYT